MTADPSNSGTPTAVPTTTMVNNDSVAPATKAMRAILGKSIKCTLDDGRTATGTLLCVDRLKNLILVNVIEERWIDSSDYSTTNTTRLLTQRELSQAMIPGTHLAKVEVEKMVYDAKMAPYLPTTTRNS